MAKSNAERQKAYRERAKELGQERYVDRINLYVPSMAKTLLEKMSNDLGLSMADTLLVCMQTCYSEHLMIRTPTPENEEYRRTSELQRYINQFHEELAKAKSDKEKTVTP